MELLKRNAKAITTFVTSVGLQTAWPYLVAAGVGSVLGFWGTVVVGGLIAAALTWVIPNVQR